MNILIRPSFIYVTILSSFCFANTNEILSYKGTASDLLKTLEPTLEYLDQCRSGKFDWTTSLPIRTLTEEARFSGSQSFLKDEIHTYTNDMLDEHLKQLISDYFNQKKISCKKKDIKLRYTSFDILSDFYSLLNANNKILTVAPTFGYYLVHAKKYNIKMELVYAKKENHWKITPDELDKALQSSNANIFLLTNPANPTGVFYSKSELEALSKVIIKHNVFVISDEIFSDIYFDEKPYSIAAIEDMQERTITLSGLGKSRGVRLSFACCPITQISTLPLSGILKPIQKAAVTTMEDTETNKTFHSNSLKDYHSRIRLIQSTINSINIKLNEYYGTHKILYVNQVIVPKTTNVFLISFPAFRGGRTEGNDKIMTSLMLAKYIYKKCSVATVPGEAFFIDGQEMILRIPMSVSERDLKEGLKLIFDALKNIDLR